MHTDHSVPATGTIGDRRRRWPGVISGIGVVTLLANGARLVLEDDLLALPVGVLFPIGLSVALTVSGLWLYRSDLDAEFLPRTTAWVLGGIAAMSPVAVVAGLYQFAEGGRVVHLPFVAFNLLTAGGIAGVLIGIYDARSRQRHRDAEQSNVRYQTLLDASPDAIFVARTTTGEIIEANDTAEELLGRSRDAILGMHQSELHPSTDGDQYRELFSRHVAAEEAIMTELPNGFDIYVVRADGTRVPVEINAARFGYQGQSLLLGVFRDISRRKRREQELKQRTDQLKILNRVVSHDILNDMNVAIGWLQMLEGQVDGDGEEILERVSQASQHVVELTDVARGYVEVVSGETTAELRPIPLASVLEEELSTHRDTYPKADFRLEGDPTDVEVRANEMVSSVFRNVLNNAVQHNDQDEPVVVVRVDDDGDDVLVRVADNGPGIPDEQQETVFGKDQKGLDSQGSGIGLYLVKTLVEEFDGEVWIDDNEPTGTIFNVRLPQA